MPIGRHRHAANVRADGLASVLGPLLRDPAVLAALLVDVDSGMVLDACGPRGLPGGVDLEQLGATHGELMRMALGLATDLGAGARPAGATCEIVVTVDLDRHLVQRRVPDPYGDRLALSVLVAGSPRVLRRTRRRLREVSVAALTAGPTVQLRPTEGEWVPGVTEERPVLVMPSRPLPDLGPRTVPTAAVPALRGPSDGASRPAPPAALPPPAQRSGPAPLTPGSPR